MAITSLTGISNAPSQQALQNADAKVQAVIASIVSGEKNTDVAALSTATQLQSETSSLKQVSSNLAQAMSLTQVADGGIAEIQQAVGELQSLASQAGSSTLNADNRKQLNQQFQQLASAVDQLAKGTSFNGQSLLDGTLSGDHALSFDHIIASQDSGSSDNNLSIADLSTNGLFGGQNLDILSTTSAQQAFTVLGNALSQVTGARASVGAFQQTLDFASANVDSAITNQQAAQSALSETDLADASTQASLADLQRNAAIALAAQGNRLSPALLKLVG